MKVDCFLSLYPDACGDGKTFARQYKTMQEVWDNCERTDWMFWMLDRISKYPDKKCLRLFSCWCARNTPLADGRTTWDLLADKRSRTAIEVSERFAVGEATEKERAAAAHAAKAATADAANAADAAADAAAYVSYSDADAYAQSHAHAAADAAAVAAAYAAAAAVAAAYAHAAAAAADARENARIAQCNQLRKMFVLNWDDVTNQTPSTKDTP